MKPTFKLVRRRLFHAYSEVFTSFSGVPCLVSAALVVSLIVATCWHLPATSYRWLEYLLGVGIAIGYCVPRGVFLAPVEQDELPHM